MTAERVYAAIEQGVCTAITRLVQSRTDTPTVDFFAAVEKGAITAITRLVRDGSDMPSADFFAALAKGVKDAMAEGVKGGMQVVPPLVSHAMKATKAAPYGAVLWTEDEWFARYCAASLTDEFKTWWLGYYGRPGDYEDNAGEQHEYWVRCAFALQGWKAARTQSVERQTGKK
jgi:hypothetical protein